MPVQAEQLLIVNQKEKCSKYIDKAQKRADDENEKEFDLFNRDGARITYLGTYYSKTQDTCLTKTTFSKRWNDKEGNKYEDKKFYYYNEFTGEIILKEINSYEAQKEAFEFEKTLNLIK